MSIKFLNNESIEIDDESDLKFYEFIEKELTVLFILFVILIYIIKEYVIKI